MYPVSWFALFKFNMGAFQFIVSQEKQGPWHFWREDVWSTGARLNQPRPRLPGHESRGPLHQWGSVANLAKDERSPCAAARFALSNSRFKKLPLSRPLESDTVLISGAWFLVVFPCFSLLVMVSDRSTTVSKIFDLAFWMPWNNTCKPFISADHPLKFCSTHDSSSPRI